MRKIKIALDVDEVLADCIGYAIKRFNKENNQQVDTFDIVGWAGDDAGWTQYFSDPEFVRTQPVLPGAQKFVQELSKRNCDILVMTAVPLNVVPERCAWLKRNFPEIKEENVIIGKRKDVCSVDILIDDGAHNVLSSPAKYPILMRRPWNQKVTGLTAVNSFDDCLNLVDTIIRQNGYSSNRDHKVICLIGPSGSGKTEVAKRLREEGYITPRIQTTSPREQEYYEKLTKEQFEQNLKMGAYAETTSYAGNYYGIRLEDMTQAMTQRKYKVVIPTDICGANALAKLYGSAKIKTVYLKRSRTDLVSGILKKDISDEEKSLRILALDSEARNESLCDETIEWTNADAVVAQIL